MDPKIWFEHLKNTAVEFGGPGSGRRKGGGSNPSTAPAQAAPAPATAIPKDGKSLPNGAKLFANIKDAMADKDAADKKQKQQKIAYDATQDANHATEKAKTTNLVADHAHAAIMNHIAAVEHRINGNNDIADKHNALARAHANIVTDHAVDSSKKANGSCQDIDHHNAEKFHDIASEMHTRLGNENMAKQHYAAAREHEQIVNDSTGSNYGLIGDLVSTVTGGHVLMNPTR